MSAPKPTIVQAVAHPSQKFGQMAKVTAVMSDGTLHRIFDYFDDELSFTAEEFKGMTLDEAHELFHKRDVAFIRS